MDKENNKIYFCGSIRGGRSDRKLYLELMSYLQNFGSILTEHIGDTELQKDQHLTDEEIYHRDMFWLAESDFVIAEVSTPSLGVGFEIARALSLNKKILCLSRADRHEGLSAMINGCPDLRLAIYSDITEARSLINSFLK